MTLPRTYRPALPAQTAVPTYVPQAHPATRSGASIAATPQLLHAPLRASERQGALLQFQRVHGNAATGKFLGNAGPSIQRAPGGTSLKLACPLFAGDTKLEEVFNDRGRLREGDSGGSVQKVQEALLVQSDKEGDPSFAVAVTANYDSATARAVRAFKTAHSLGSTQFGDVGPGTMRELDRLCPSAAPPKPSPQEDRNLEDVLDNIGLQHQILLKSQNDAIVRLEADLLTPDKPSSLGSDALKAIDKAIFSGVFGLVGDFLKKQLKDVNMTDDDRTFVQDNGVGPIMDKLKEVATGKVDPKIDELLEQGGTPLDTFIDSQKELLTDSSADAQETFLTVTRPALRQPKDGGDSGEDPRLERARKYVAGLKKARTGAFDLQYHQSIEKFAAGSAQAALGTTGGGPFPEQLGVDLGRLTTRGNADNVPGLLRLDVDGEKADKPVKVTGAKILLSDKARKRLTKENRSLLDLQFPMIASGPVNPGFPIFNLKFFNSRILIGRNEVGKVFEIDSTEGGRSWLKVKAGLANDFLPDVPPADAERGAARVFDEIETKTLSALGVKLE